MKPILENVMFQMDGDVVRGTLHSDIQMWT